MYKQLTLKLNLTPEALDVIKNYLDLIHLHRKENNLPSVTVVNVDGTLPQTLNPTCWIRYGKQLRRCHVTALTSSGIKLLTSFRDQTELIVEKSIDAILYMGSVELPCKPTISTASAFTPNEKILDYLKKIASETHVNDILLQMKTTESKTLVKKQDKEEKEPNVINYSSTKKNYLPGARK